MSDYILDLVSGIPKSVTKIAFAIDMRFIVVCNVDETRYYYTVAEIGRKPMVILDEGAGDTHNFSIGDILVDVVDDIQYSEYATEFTMLDYDVVSSAMDTFRKNDFEKPLTAPPTTATEITMKNRISTTRVMKMLAEQSGMKTINNDGIGKTMVHTGFSESLQDIKDFDFGELYPKIIVSEINIPEDTTNVALLVDGRIGITCEPSDNGWVYNVIDLSAGVAKSVIVDDGTIGPFTSVKDAMADAILEASRYSKFLDGRIVSVDYSRMKAFVESLKSIREDWFEKLNNDTNQ